MTQDVLQGTVEGVSIAHTVQNLKFFMKSGQAATVWQRPKAPPFQEWIDDLNPDELPSTRLILKPQDVIAALEQVFDRSGTQDEMHRKSLIEDIVKLTNIFCGIMRVPLVRLRLDRVTDNACSKFHIDSIVARLVCTYRGTGTQYGISTNGEEPTNILTVSTGNPMLMRGTRWPEKSNINLLHRSPQIEGSKETRFVLVIDPIFDADQEM